MGWVLDLDGVMWLGDEPILRAAEAVSMLDAEGIDVVFVTNNSSATIGQYVDKLGRHGVDADGRVVSAATAGATLVEPGERVLICAGPGVEEALSNRGVETVRDGAADVVMVGFHRDFNYERLRIASSAVRNGARLVATNHDLTFPTPTGLEPGGGSILAAVVAASGATPIIAGKPHESMAALVRSRIGPNGVVVGDRPDTDGEFAVTLGFAFGLVLSGVTTSTDLPITPEPIYVADDLFHLVSDYFGTSS